MERKFEIGKAIAATGEFVKTNRKPLLYIAGAAVVVVAGIAITKGVSGGITSFFNPGKNVKGGTGFSKQNVDLTKTTIDEPTAKAYANQLWNAMKDGGTKEGEIKAVMNAINGEDYKLIYNAFGERSYYVNGEPTISAWLFGYSDLDMNQWFKRELDKWTDYFTYNLVKEKSTAAGLAF